MNDSLLYEIALTKIPGIGCMHARLLLRHFSPAAVFKAKKTALQQIEGLGDVRIKSIQSFNGFAEIENEILFIEKYKITPLFITDAAYPQHLLHCCDAPTLLYYKGDTAQLNTMRTVAIVGTRNSSEYGRQVTEKLVDGLATHGVMVASGLAYGIDAIAHKACLKNKLPTVGVLAHGLDKIYPAAHAGLAREMMQEGGGLLTEFTSGTIPDRYNFPARNRIVAGMADATIVIETDKKGGSMITAEIANSYNKDVYAIPGRTGDKKSAGCNDLIKNNKAVLLTDAAQLLEAMGWAPAAKKASRPVRELFIQLTDEEKSIVDILAKNTASIDEINQQCGLSTSSIAAAILSLEMQNVIQVLPGKLYQLL